jgi:hypothetical protein
MKNTFKQHRNSVQYWAALIAVLGSLASPPTFAQVSISIPGLSIGINLPQLPRLVQVPGYPVYYAPQVRSNYFFYEGMYWVFESNHWYSSVWYNGPWTEVNPQSVPVYILRVPVKYYRSPPPFFQGRQASEAPRWAEYWGDDWAKHRPGWDQWDRRLKPRPAPLPSYQRQYPAPRYPKVEQQLPLHERNYPYLRQDNRGSTSAAPGRGRQGESRDGGNPGRNKNDWRENDNAHSSKVQGGDRERGGKQ